MSDLPEYTEDIELSESAQREIELLAENPTFDTSEASDSEELEELVLEKYGDAYADPELAEQRANEALEEFMQEEEVDYLSISGRIYADKCRDLDVEDVEAALSGGYTDSYSF